MWTWGLYAASAPSFLAPSLLAPSLLSASWLPWDKELSPSMAYHQDISALGTYELHPLKSWAKNTFSFFKLCMSGILLQKQNADWYKYFGLPIRYVNSNIFLSARLSLFPQQCHYHSLSHYHCSYVHFAIPLRALYNHCLLPTCLTDGEFPGSRELGATWSLYVWILNMSKSILKRRWFVLMPQTALNVAGTNVQRLKKTGENQKQTKKKSKSSSAWNMIRRPTVPSQNGFEAENTTDRQVKKQTKKKLHSKPIPKASEVGHGQWQRFWGTFRDQSPHLRSEMSHESRVFPAPPPPLRSLCFL